jgi:RNA polymerase sigma factor (sigma-70 family)
MRSRQSIVEIFSTFIQFDGDAFRCWVIDPKLQRSIHRCLKQFARQESEKFWAIYWHRIWQVRESLLASAHLTAYLQEVCYWVARTMTMNVPGEHSIADFFQTAIARTNKVLKRFNPEFSSNLKLYAEYAFSNIIKDQLRQRKEADICTDWGLLHKLSQKRLIESLQQVGYNSQTIKRYILAWNCFLQLYTPNEVGTVHKLLEPDNLTLQAIAQFYNTQRLSQLSSPGSACAPETIKTWLLICARSVRSFQYPTLVSINTPILETDSEELLSRFTENFQQSVLDEIIAQEEAQTIAAQTSEINSVLTNTLETLDTKSQQILQAYYWQGLTQQQIAEQFGVKQYTVSRQLTRVKRTLLMALAQWSQQVLHTSLTSDVINSMSNTLEEWLECYYRNPLSSSEESLQ